MEQNDVTRTGLNRRTFMSFGAVAAAAALSPLRAQAAPTAKKSVVRSLSFFNTHTGERLATTYCCDGKYDPEALEAINHILRDWRVDEVKPIESKRRTSTEDSKRLILEAILRRYSVSVPEQTNGDAAVS